MFLSRLIDLQPGRVVFNYAAKPDLMTREIVRIANDALGRPLNNGITVPCSVGMAVGYCFDVLARVTGKTLSISSVRVQKFCAETTISMKRPPRPRV